METTCYRTQNGTGNAVIVVEEGNQVYTQEITRDSMGNITGFTCTRISEQAGIDSTWVKRDPGEDSSEFTTPLFNIAFGIPSMSYGQKMRAAMLLNELYAVQEGSTEDERACMELMTN